MVVKVSPHPIPDLKEFLTPFAPHFWSAESFRALERYATGLLSDVEHKSGAAVAAAVAGLSEPALYRLMTGTYWKPRGVDQQRVGIMGERAAAGDGVLVVDDT